MKLLIVDDEELTRTGVISSINWKELGIQEIFQADDGIHGLEVAKDHRPEIILCDVRMPRMDGITMLGELEQVLPNTVPIFMSGYSDKEYLKAAIRLKAVGYIEKPINPSEIREAILEAKEMYAQKVRSTQGVTFHSIETASRLALQLTVPYGSNDDIIAHLSRELGLDFMKNTSFTSFIVKLNTVSEVTELPLDEIFHLLKALLTSAALSSSHGKELYQSAYERSDSKHCSDMDCIYAEKRGQYVVYFVFGSQIPSPELITAVQNLLHDQYQEFGSHFIAIGETTTGLSQAYRSYASAVILLQSSFFFPSGTVLTASATTDYACSGVASVLAENMRSSTGFPSTSAITETVHSGTVSSSAPAFEENIHSRAVLPTAPDAEFARFLSQKEENACNALLAQLYSYFDHNCSLLPNQARDLYYKLFLALSDARRQLTTVPVESEETIADTLERCFTYHELHQILCQRTDAFFRDSQNLTQENPTISLIKDYISKNYMNETLSVKDISAHVFLSASYVCTYFKNETGQTLNQYLTEYRMEKAKQLLGDPRYKITDISSKVGYNDGNYFGKSFKKYSGLSPSEYREKTLR